MCGIGLGIDVHMFGIKPMDASMMLMKCYGGVVMMMKGTPPT